MPLLCIKNLVLTIQMSEKSEKWKCLWAIKILYSWANKQWIIYVIK